MKKTYIRPEMLIEQLAIQQMVCASEPNAGIDTTKEVEAGSVDARRSFSSWGDDEE